MAVCENKKKPLFNNIFLSPIPQWCFRNIQKLESFIETLIGNNITCKVHKMFTGESQWNMD